MFSKELLDYLNWIPKEQYDKIINKEVLVEEVVNPITGGITIWITPNKRGENNE